MTVLSPARRVGSFDELEQAGDYTGPNQVKTYYGEVSQVLYLLPIHRGKDKYDHSIDGSGVHGVMSPPHTFRECADGSLEIRESIGCGDPRYWHGYLDEGNVWRQV